MNTATTTPLPEKGMGCIGKGCLTGAGLVVFLMIAFIAGTYWAVHYLQQTYSAPEPITLAETSEETPAVTTEPLTTAPVAPTAVPQPTIAPAKRWKAFEKAKETDPNANIVLSAGEINSLLSANSKTRGKVSVAIDNNVGRVQFSIPLKGVFLMDGRYVNGGATVEASPDGNPSSARISNIKLNGRDVPDSVLDQRLFGWSPMRSYITKWLNDEGITSFKIEGNRVIGQKQGSGSF